MADMMFTNIMEKVSPQSKKSPQSLEDAFKTGTCIKRLTWAPGGLSLHVGVDLETFSVFVFACLYPSFSTVSTFSLVIKTNLDMYLKGSVIFEE